MAAAIFFNMLCLPATSAAHRAQSQCNCFMRLIAQARMTKDSGLEAIARLHRNGTRSIWQTKIAVGIRNRHVVVPDITFLVSEVLADQCDGPAAIHVGQRNARIEYRGAIILGVGVQVQRRVKRILVVHV